MASLRVLAYDLERRPVVFDTWHDDMKLYLLNDLKDSVSLFDHVSGDAPTPPAIADISTRSQWLSRDATARLAICNHLPATECAHFGEHRTAQALYDTVVARYSSPATAAIEGYDDWAWKMQLYFRQIGLLKLMIGEEPRPSDPALQEDWDERASAGYYLMSQSLELNQRHHVMHLLPKVDCGRKAWTVLKELHAPTSVLATLMLEKNCPRCT
ncbi:unnamed protein product [Closterium sp. NIES-53]